MSLAAIALATRDTLQTTFGTDAESCEVGFDGKPKPSCGELYLAVHSPSWQGISGDYDLHEEAQLAVTLTMRIGFAPKDRYGIAVWLEATDGMDRRCRQVITALHHNQAVRIAANAYLADWGREGSGLIITPLQFLQAQPVTVRDYTWFDAVMPANPSEHKLAESGVSQTLFFGKCQRCQNIPDME